MAVQAEALEIQRQTALTALDESRAKVRQINAQAMKLESEAQDTGAGLPPEVQSQITRMQEQAAQQIENLTQQLHEANRKAADQTLKVKTDADVKVQTARITADATMRAAEIAAASDKQIEAVLKRMDDLVRQVQVTNKAAIEATRTAEQAEKRAEAAAAAAAAATPAPEPAKAAPDPAAPPPAQPITLHVQIDAKPGPVTRQVVVERDKDGNMVSATAVDKVPATEKEGK